MKTKTVENSREPDIDKESEPKENPNGIFISDAETRDGDEQEPIQENNNDNIPNVEEIEKEQKEVEPDIQKDDPPPQTKNMIKGMELLGNMVENENLGQKSMLFPSEAKKAKEDEHFIKFS